MHRTVRGRIFVSAIGTSLFIPALFGVGSALYGRTPQAVVMGVVFVGTGIGLLRLMPKLWGGRQ